MTYSIYAIVANEVSPSGCSAYTYTLNGMLPYLRAPWYQFSEQEVDDVSTNGGTNPAFTFLTGHGGFYQVAPFGFLGLRTDKAVLTLSPSLPPQIPHLRLRTFHFGGATFTASMNSTHTVLTRLPTPPDTGVVDVFAELPVPLSLVSDGSIVPYTISINQSLVLPNRTPWLTSTVQGNIAQCVPATSPDAHAQGRFLLAAVDGATSTRWQPATNDSATLVIDTSASEKSVGFGAVREIAFDWGTRPPRAMGVVLSNSSLSETNSGLGGGVRLEIPEVTPSLPYNATEFAISSQQVSPYVGNTSVLSVPPGTWSARYVRVVVEGCWEEDGMGATVGEVVVVV